jgi:hypothetical protein
VITSTDGFEHKQTMDRRMTEAGQLLVYPNRAGSRGSKAYEMHVVRNRKSTAYWFYSKNE